MNVFRDKLPTYLDRRFHELRCSWSKLFTLVNGFYRGVEIGSGCRFNGIPLIRRAPGSQIFIGSDCKFNSAVKSILIGVDRPCILSTTHPGASIHIGKKCGFSGTVIISVTGISLGDHVTCGANTLLADSDFKPVDSVDRLNHVFGPSAPIVLEENVFLGMYTSVLKGVTIGKNTVVAAGSLVTKSLPADVVAAGRPAKVIRKI